MRAVRGDSGSLVEWTTSTEDGTAAFQLYRLGADEQWTAVGDWVVADAKSAQGAVYRVADPGLVPGTRATYAVVERERGGKPQTYGPYTVGFDRAQPADPDATPGRRGRIVSAAELDRLAAMAVERMAATAAFTDNASAAREASFKTALKITVGERGLTAVPAAQIATGFGMNETAIRARIENGTLRLETEGTTVSTFPGVDGAALYFYAAPKNDLYSSEGVYWLSLGNGSPMGAGAVTPTLIAPATRFDETLKLETDAIAVLAVPGLAPDSDYWFWDVVSGGGASKDFTIALPDAAQVGSDGSITIRLRGATSVGVTGEHQVDVRLNGQFLGTETFTGNAEHVATFPVPHALTATGQLVVSLSSQLPSGVDFSAQFVDGFEVSYARRHRGASGSVEFDAAAGEQVAIAAFTGSGIAVLDITDAQHPKRLAGSRELPNRGGTWTVSFRNQVPARLLVARLADAAQPISVERRSPPDLIGLSGAEYVVIAPTALASEAADLATYRAGQGLSSIAVSLDDIYDEFAFGYPRPAAIRDFLRAAYENWSKPPRYVVLAGEGTYDYRGLTGLGGNLVPARLIETPQGLFAADASYGDVDGDGVSEMSVGRLPVGSGSELGSWLARLQAQESAPADAAFRQRMILASDTGSAAAGGDFKPPAEAFASRLNAPAEVLPVHLSDLGTSAARNTLLAELNAGASALVYYGHAGLDRLADESILTSADVPGIANAGRSPLVVALTCSINRFELPGFSSLGEELVRSSTGGAIAVWSPSGLSGTTNANLLGDILASRLYASPSQRVGDVLLDVADRYVASGGSKDVLALYHLMGDPATIVNAPVAPEPPAGPPSSGE